MLIANSIMTTNIITLTPTETVRDAYETMREFSFRHIPIVDLENKLVGIISEGDVLKSCYWEGNKIILPETSIGEIMSNEVTTCLPESPLGSVVATMLVCKIDCIPIIYNEYLEGIITSTDIMEIFCKLEEEKGNAIMPFDFLERKHVASNQN